MAWSSATLDSGDITYYNAGLPMFVAKSAEDDASQWDLIWNNTGTWVGAGPDQTASYFPTHRLTDWSQHAASESGTNSATQYVIINTGGSFSFDCCLLGVNGFGDDSVTQVDLQIADDNLFATNLQTIATWTTGLDNGRLGEFVLKHTGSDPLVYSDVPYIRLKIAGSSSTPYLTEFILGERLQMSHWPNYPFFRYTWGHNLSPGAASYSGSHKRVTWGHTVRKYTAEFEPDDSTQQTRFESLYSQTQQGTRAFVFVPDASSDASDWYLCQFDQPSFDFPYTAGTNKRVASLQFSEMPPGRALGP